METFTKDELVLAGARLHNSPHIATEIMNEAKRQRRKENVITTGTFTAQELRAAARLVGTTVEMVLEQMMLERFDGPSWTPAELKEAAQKTGYNQVTLGEVIQNARTHQEESVLFTKDDLLAVAGTEVKKMLVHGVFGMLGTDAANEAALISEATKAGYTLAMKSMIAKVKDREDWQPGDVVRDARGKYWKRVYPGMWADFDTSMHFGDDIPVRPLRKMP